MKTIVILDSGYCIDSWVANLSDDELAILRKANGLYDSAIETKKQRKAFKEFLKIFTLDNKNINLGKWLPFEFGDKIKEETRLILIGWRD